MYTIFKIVLVILSKVQVDLLWRQKNVIFPVFLYLVQRRLYQGVEIVIFRQNGILYFYFNFLQVQNLIARILFGFKELHRVAQEVLEVDGNG